MFRTIISLPRASISPFLPQAWFQLPQHAILESSLSSMSYPSSSLTIAGPDLTQRLFFTDFQYASQRRRTWCASDAAIEPSSALVGVGFKVQKYVSFINLSWSLSSLSLMSYVFHWSPSVLLLLENLRVSKQSFPITPTCWGWKSTGLKLHGYQSSGKTWATVASCFCVWAADDLARSNSTFQQHCPMWSFWFKMLLL